MIGRFARGLGDRPVAPLLAGAILLVLGVWHGGEALFATYPGAADLEVIEAQASESVEVVRRRGALARFLDGPSLEMQAVLPPDDRIVLYRDDMPDYDAVKAATGTGPAFYGLWPAAPADEDRHRIWSLVTTDGTTVVSLDRTVAGLRASREQAAVLPGLLGVLGLGLLIFGLRRWRAVAR